jgi:hypothetical protein
MLNLNGSLLKAGINFSTLWSEDFTDDKFRVGLRKWLMSGLVTHVVSHVRKLRPSSTKDALLGRRFAQDFRRRKAIMGVFDEGCMGMYNAIIPDEILHPTGVFKERLSQSSLFAAMLTVKPVEATAALRWLLRKGLTFAWGKNEKTELTRRQTLEQLKMYIAAVRLADEFGCATIGIQYQQGLKDLAPASDLVEGLLNNRERPPVFHAKTGKELFKGDALPHVNEVDECAGLDGLITYQLWKQRGFDPENTLLVRGLWPDFKDQVGPVTVTVKARMHPQDTDGAAVVAAMAPGDAKADFLISGRLLRLRLAGESAPTGARIGTPTFDVAPAGHR